MTVEEACQRGLTLLAEIEAGAATLRSKRDELRDLSSRVATTAKPLAESGYFTAAGKTWKVVESPQGDAVELVPNPIAAAIGDVSLAEKE